MVVLRTFRNTPKKDAITILFGTTTCPEQGTSATEISESSAQSIFLKHLNTQNKKRKLYITCE
jgi:hypothetical protein